MPLADTHKKLQQGQGFASLKLIDDFITNGALPSIHTDMGTAMGLVPLERRKAALDLGACHGLLSVLAARLGWTHVHGIDIDPPTVKIAADYVVPRAEGRVSVEAKRLDVLGPDFEGWMVRTCGAYGINTILARRAFPELFSDTYGKRGLEEATWRAAGRRFTEVALLAGIEFVVIEGRKWQGYANLKNPLFRVDNEIAALGAGWREIGRHRECVVLERAA